MTTPVLAEQVDLDAATLAFFDRAIKRFDQRLDIREDD